jgi:hypothetical protein
MHLRPVEGQACRLRRDPLGRQRLGEGVLGHGRLPGATERAGAGGSLCSGAGLTMAGQHQLQPGSHMQDKRIDFGLGSGGVMMRLLLGCGNEGPLVKGCRLFVDASPLRSIQLLSHPQRHTQILGRPPGQGRGI